MTYLFTFTLKGWIDSHAAYRGGGSPSRPPAQRQASAVAPSENEARMIVNPHIAPWRASVAMTKKFEAIAPTEAQWYRQVAATHSKAAKYFNQAAVLIGKVPIGKLDTPHTKGKT